MKRLIAFLAVMMLVSSAYGTATSITIYGTNKSNAQTNVTCYGCNQTISVQAWNTTYVKNISVHSRNGSGGDAVSFNISNVTAYQVQELKVNGTSINAYQAGANGMLNFTYTVVGNRTLVLSPASRAMGYNFTWGYFETIRGIGTGDTLFAGDVGIRNTAPIAPLDIQTAADAHISFGSTEAIPTGIGYFRIGYDGTDEYGYLAPFLGGTGDQNLILNPWGGNVGIGSTTAPTQKLDVAGGINATHMNVSGGFVFAPTTQATNATLSRGQDTVYQNGHKPMLLSIVTDTNGVERTIKTDANNPPTTVVAITDADTPAYASQTTAVILPRNFYMLDSASTVTISYWTEWT